MSIQLAQLESGNGDDFAQLSFLQLLLCRSNFQFEEFQFSSVEVMSVYGSLETIPRALIPCIGSLSTAEGLTLRNKAIKTSAGIILTFWMRGEHGSESKSPIRQCHHQNWLDLRASTPTELPTYTLQRTTFGASARACHGLAVANRDVRTLCTLSAAIGLW